MGQRQTAVDGAGRADRCLGHYTELLIGTLDLRPHPGHRENHVYRLTNVDADPDITEYVLPETIRAIASELHDSDGDVVMLGPVLGPEARLSHGLAPGFGHGLAPGFGHGFRLADTSDCRLDGPGPKCGTHVNPVNN